MDLTKKIAAAAGALTLGVAGVAAAATTPDAADAGLSKASENVGVELPASHDAQSTADDSTAEDTTADDVTAEVEDETEGPEDNHGAIVSGVAQTEFETGREHGEAVSAAARDNHGAEVSGDESDEDELEAEDDDELEDESTETGDEAEEHGDDADAAGAHARK